MSQRNNRVEFEGVVLENSDLICANCGAKFIEGQFTCAACGGGLVVSTGVPTTAPCGRCKTPNQPLTGECSSCGASLPYSYTSKDRVDQAREDLRDAKQKAFEGFQDIRRATEARHASYKQAALQVLIWFGKAIRFMLLTLLFVIIAEIWSNNRRKDKGF